jgi:hypothetical protein
MTLQFCLSINGTKTFLHDAALLAFTKHSSPIPPNFSFIEINVALCTLIFVVYDQLSLSWYDIKIGRKQLQFLNENAAQCSSFACEYS